MKRYNKTPSSISDLLQGFAFVDNDGKKKSISTIVKHSAIFSFWEDIVGAKFSKFTKPLQIKYGNLYVTAKSPIIVQELNFHKVKLLEKINTYSQALGFKVKDIIFDYKNFSQSNSNDIPLDDKPVWYEDLSDIKLDRDFELEVKNAIDKINFLDNKQKEMLEQKILNTKRAQKKRAL